MLTRDDINNLATLARIALSDEEKSTLPNQLDAILNYVSEISSVATKADSVPRVGSLRNVMRLDTDAYVGGEYRDSILENAPNKEDGYVKVKQIL